MDRAEFGGQGGVGGAAPRLCTEGRRRVTHERAAALLTEDKPFVAELTVGTLHCHELHMPLLGEGSCRWKSVAWLVRTVRTRDLRAEFRCDVLGRGRLLGRCGALIHTSEGNWT